MKDARWFKHDSNARNDQKLIMIRAKHGAAGYGAYFMIIEILRDSVGYKIPANQMLEPSLALATGCQPDFMKQLLADCFDYGLLVNDGEYVWSDSLMRRMDDYAELCEKNRNAGRLGGLAKASARQANAKQTLSYREDVEEKKESKETTTAQKAAPSVSPEAEALTMRLVELMRGNNPEVRIPASLKPWLIEADRLLRIDKRPLDQALAVLDWCQKDSFWHRNILSMAKFRDQYDQLLLKSGKQAAPTKPTMDEEERRGKEQAARLRAEYRAATGQSK